MPQCALKRLSSLGIIVSWFAWSWDGHSVSNVSTETVSVSVLHDRGLITVCDTSLLRQYHHQFCMIVSWSLCMTLLYWVSFTVSFAWLWADHCVWHSSTGSVSPSVLHDCAQTTPFYIIFHFLPTAALVTTMLLCDTSFLLRIGFILTWQLVHRLSKFITCLICDV